MDTVVIIFLWFVFQFLDSACSYYALKSKWLSYIVYARTVVSPSNGRFVWCKLQSTPLSQRLFNSFYDFSVLFVYLCLCSNCLDPLLKLTWTWIPAIPPKVILKVSQHVLLKYSVNFLWPKIYYTSILLLGFVTWLIIAPTLW